MSMGTLPLIATERPGNLVHVVLDNEAYESTGAQPSITSSVNLADVAESCGYARVFRVNGTDELEHALSNCALGGGPFLLLVKVGIATVEGIPRVSHSPTGIRDRFSQTIQHPD
jgi:phosphonopyruvate decarboxylase